jgi:hypothetical protein
MAGITLTQANTHLQAWLTAEIEVTTNQSYTIGTRTLTRANLGEIRKQIDYWQNTCNRLENVAKYGGRNRVRRIVPRDL